MLQQIHPAMIRGLALFACNGNPNGDFGNRFIDDLAWYAWV